MKRRIAGAWACVGATTIVSLIFVASSCGGSDDGGTSSDGDAATDSSVGGDGHPIEGGSDVVGENGDVLGACTGPGPSPDAWGSYGHDARRTSASNGCIHGPFTQLWKYSGVTVDGSPQGYPMNAVADTTGLYVHAGFTVPTVDKVSLTGSNVWHHVGHADYDDSNWLTVGLGYVMADDDGVYLFDVASGDQKSTSGVDWWGQTAVDDTRFYVVTTTHGDGPGAFVGAWDVAKGLLWKANVQGGCSPAIGDENGGLAVDAGVVYYAPRYMLGKSSFGGVTEDTGPLTYPSGLYAFDAATGTKKWSVGTSPRSSISVGDGHVYLVEPGPKLVARKTTDGSIAWSATLTGDETTIGSSPPTLAGGLVIVGTSTGVFTFDATSGAAGWTKTIPGAGRHAFDQATINFVSCPSAGEPVTSLAATTLAAATASDTLVVTANDAIHVLSLASGAESSTHPLKNASDPIVVGDRLYVLDASSGLPSVVALQSK